VKINKKEMYSLDLEEEELMFFLNIIKEMNLSDKADFSTIQLYHKFKQFREDLIIENEEINEGSVVQNLSCEICGSLEEVKERMDLVSNETIQICLKCHTARKEALEYANLIKESNE